MSRQATLRLAARVAILAGGTGMLALMLTTDIHPIWWVIAGVPTALALPFYAIGRESRLDPLVAERKTGFVGRFARLGLGVIALYLVLVWGRVPLAAFALWGLVGVLVLLLLVAILELFGLMTRLSQTKEWALGSVILVLGLYILGPAEVKLAIVGLGVLSLVLSGLFGYAGCEMAAVPNLLLGKRYVLGCVFFSPLDRLEARWRARGRERPGE